eukprot:scaffold118057_cov23-Prasinocladus_malaysianus.AAC.1
MHICRGRPHGRDRRRRKLPTATATEHEEEAQPEGAAGQKDAKEVTTICWGLTFDENSGRQPAKSIGQWPAKRCSRISTLGVRQARRCKAVFCTKA